MKKLLLLSFIAALLLSACGDPDEEALPEEALQEDDKPSRLREGSLVSHYYEPDTLITSFYSFSKGRDRLRIFIDLCDWDEWNHRCHYIEDNDVIKKYQAYYGDTTYSQMHVSHCEYEACTMPLTSISITADRDFDAEHPAGSLLNDLFIFEYSSAYNIIKSGYDPDLDYSYSAYLLDIGKIDIPNPFQQMPLSEFETINLLYGAADLYFTKLPDTLGEYTFTITYELGDDPVTGKEARKIPPAVVKAEFTEADHVTLPPATLPG